MSPETASVVAEIVPQPTNEEVLQRLYPVLDSARNDVVTLSNQAEQEVQGIRAVYASRIAEAENRVNRLEAAKLELSPAPEPVQEAAPEEQPQG